MLICVATHIIVVNSVYAWFHCVNLRKTQTEGVAFRSCSAEDYIGGSYSYPDQDQRDVGLK